MIFLALGSAILIVINIVIVRVSINQPPFKNAILESCQAEQRKKQSYDYNAAKAICSPLVDAAKTTIYTWLAIASLTSAALALNVWFLCEWKEERDDGKTESI